MQFVSGYGNASNILLTAQKRLVRPLYAQTQGYPYAATLDPSLRNTDGSIRVPLSTDTTPLTRSATAFTYQNSLIPGLVMVQNGATEAVVVASGANAAEQPMGLLGQWVGGTFDNVGQNSQVGIWLGPDSVFELLAPAWDDSSVSTAVAAATAGQAVHLYAGPDGRLMYLASPANRLAVATVMDRPSAARLVIKMLI